MDGYDVQANLSNDNNNVKEQRFTVIDLSEAELHGLTKMYSSQVDDVLPLTKSQEYFFYKQNTISCNSYIQYLFKVNAFLTPEEFSEHMKEAVQEYPILRTVFYKAETRVLQVLLQDGGVETSYHYLDHLSSDELEKTLENIMDADRRRGFDISRDRLLRIIVIKTGVYEYAVLVSQPQLLVDGWNITEVLKNIFKNQEEIYGEAVIPFINYDYSLEYLSGHYTQDHSPAHRYWKNFLNDLPAAPQIPGYKAFDGVYEQSVASMMIDSVVTNLVIEAAERNQQRMVGILQGAWGMMLQIFNGSEDIYFDSILSNRNAGSKKLSDIAIVINSMPTRIKCTEDMIIDNFLKKQCIQNMLSLQFNYCDKQEFQDIIGYKNEMRHFLNFHNLWMDSDSYVNCEIPFGATLVAVNSFDYQEAVLGVYFKLHHDKIIVEFVYNKQSFEESKITFIKQYFAITLRILLNNLHQPVGIVKNLILSESAKLEDLCEHVALADMNEFLSHIDMFESLTFAQRSEFLKRAKFLSFLDNDIILTEGMKQKYIYFVVHGNVEVSRRSFQGWQNSLEIIAEKAIVNYIQIEEQGASVVRVEALGDSVVLLAIPTDDFCTLLVENKFVMWKYIRFIHKEINKYQRLWINE